MKAQDLRIWEGGGAGKVIQDQGFRLIGHKPIGADANIWGSNSKSESGE